jgi:hypothetical protein
MMTNDKLAELQREDQAYKARENADRNPGHPSSWSEPILADYNEQVAKAGEKLTEIREAKDDLAVIDKAREIGEAIGMPMGESVNGFRLHQTAVYLERQTQFGDIFRP